MKIVERIALSTLFIAVCALVLSVSIQPLQAKESAAKGSHQRQTLEIQEGELIMGAGRFKLAVVPLPQGQGSTLVRFDTATGDYAVLDTEVGAWIAVEIPLVSPAGNYENDAHIRIISNQVFQ